MDYIIRFTDDKTAHACMEQSDYSWWCWEANLGLVTPNPMLGAHSPHSLEPQLPWVMLGTGDKRKGLVIGGGVLIRVPCIKQELLKINTFSRLDRTQKIGWTQKKKGVMHSSWKIFIHLYVVNRVGNKDSQSLWKLKEFQMGILV